ncbi:hypothetical protein RSOLAG1IB_07873 [Rhizoctonia solani AG-1 IB]|uniref:Zn(2)-C6 fungal-type domain-containing protein n=1 Tax=Thanatephorus cucumeris (strain AG1-IB / isolate 7/3/14) TaxID=1108050 RepID=A0A0B7FHW5_THACB|nr:hypothetical protein RSOLAG1IB_07873 [Rhizoctonia solani AG-1 IB]
MIKQTITTGNAYVYPILTTYQTCLACRGRKQKCDATKPECHECLTTNSRCQYENECYRTRIEALQSKIRELEAQIRRLGDQGISHSSRQTMEEASFYQLCPDLTYQSCSPVSQAPVTPPGATGEVISYSTPVLPTFLSLFSSRPQPNHQQSKFEEPGPSAEVIRRLPYSSPSARSLPGSKMRGENLQLTKSCV